MNTSTLSLQIGNGLLVSQAFDVCGGLFLLLIGGTWLIYIGATVSKHSPFTWGMIVLALAYVAHWLWKRVKALLGKMQPIAAADPWSALPIEPAESLGASSATTVSLSSPRSKSRSAGSIFIVLGLGILALALWQARGLLKLGHGIRTSGRVVELSEGTGDRTGARPSPFKVGDTVPVIYLPGNPATATIDRGPGNWAPFGGSVAMGLVMAGLGVFALRSRK